MNLRGILVALGVAMIMLLGLGIFKIIFENTTLASNSIVFMAGSVVLIGLVFYADMVQIKPFSIRFLCSKATKIQHATIPVFPDSGPTYAALGCILDVGNRTEIFATYPLIEVLFFTMGLSMYCVYYSSFHDA